MVWVSLECPGYILLVTLPIAERAAQTTDLVLAEINALEMRTKGASLAMATNWICSYAVVQATLPGIANLGYKFWAVWAVICASFIPITYLFYPETANRTLEGRSHS